MSSNTCKLVVRKYLQYTHFGPDYMVTMNTKIYTTHSHGSASVVMATKLVNRKMGNSTPCHAL